MSGPSKKTLVIGASDNPQRYSYLAVNRLRSKGYPVVGIGKTPATIGDVTIESQQKDFPDIDTVTLYLNPRIQQQYYDYIISLHPRRIIFNPGTENPELEQLAKDNGILPIEACTLVMLSTGQY